MISEKFQTYVDPRGFVIDTETGEVLGCPEPRPQFHVTDRESAEWVLHKMQDLQAEKVAIEARLKALTDNLNAQIHEVERRLGFLQYRFGGELFDWAREEIAKQPHGPKHVKTDYGKIGFRATKGSIKVADEEAALSWAERQAPEAVVIKKAVHVSALPQALKQDVFDAPERYGFFAVEPPTEKGYIETGL